MVLMLIIIAIVLVLLVAVSSITIRPSELSNFELERTKYNDDPETKRHQEKSTYFRDLVSLQRLVAAVLLTVSVVLLVSYTGWLWGTILSVLVALEYGVAAQFPPLRRIAQKLYDRYEASLILLIKRYPGIFRLFRSVTLEAAPTALHSHEELVHLVENALDVFDQNERKLIVHGLQFRSKRVREIMTPRSIIVSIKKSELLGPLVLDDLHKTGFSRFPVIGSDIDHVVGVLYLRDLLILDGTKKHTAKVETAMHPKAYFINETDTLEHALAAFLKTHQHMFIVVNAYRETVGLLTLEDVIESLLGRKIVDEFDRHDDLRLVAERHAKQNNVGPTV